MAMYIRYLRRQGRKYIQGGGANEDSQNIWEAEEGGGGGHKGGWVGGKLPPLPPGMK